MSAPLEEEICAEMRGPAIISARRVPTQHRLKARLLLCGVLISCAPAPPSGAPSQLPPNTDLIGYRALIGTAVKSLIPLFDRDSPPMFRVCGDVNDPWHVVITTPAGEHTPQMERDGTDRGPCDLVRTRVDGKAMAPGPGEVEIVTNLGGSDGTRVLARWPIRWDMPPRERPALRAIHRIGDPIDARRALRSRLPEMEPWTHQWGLVELARLENRAGAANEALATWMEAAEAALNVELPTEAARRWRAAAHIQRTRRRFTEAYALLDRAEVVERRTGHAVGLARVSYYRGSFALDLADYTQARRSFEQALEIFHAYGQDRDAAMTAVGLATVDSAMGRHLSALVALEQAHAWFERNRHVDSLEYARSLTNVGWCWFLAMDRGALPMEPDVPRRLLEAAKTWVLKASPDRELDITIETNLAAIAWLAGDQEATRSGITEARDLEPGARGANSIYLSLLEAELDLLERRHTRAIDRFGHVLTEARDALDGQDSDAVWQALHGIGRAQRDMGVGGLALETFQQSWATVLRLARRTRISSDRAPFFGDRHAVMADTLETLLQMGDIFGAFAVVGAWHGQVLSGLETQVRISRLDPAQREAWFARMEGCRMQRETFVRESEEDRSERLPPRKRRAWQARRATQRSALKRCLDDAYADLDTSLRGTTSDPAPVGDHAATIGAALAPGEALVVFVWVHHRRHGFWVSGDGSVEHSVMDNNLLSPWMHRLERLKHLYIVAGGLPDAYRLSHSRDETGRFLIERIGISYLPHPGALLWRTPAPSGPPLVVSDPNANLLSARAEGRAVAMQLSVEPLIWESASHGAVLAGLDGASVFHFAGHGVLRGDDPWASHLVLAEGRQLTLADILMNRPTTGVVFLNGCETGGLASTHRYPRVGLPEAFLLVGGRAVLAADRRIDDNDARAFADRFYAAGGATAPGPALRAVAETLIAEENDLWTAYRLVGRP